ncbi:hypothetical protein E2493_00930 [Sphingomonas parva]|uniref:Tetratricopeptide repeat protein n=1 Tax=Sphingomonas parva TaxID=2555898 RepID=A0A4Y8ZYA0_9SPHN|nr:hypothetical protein [Sphingomonas parva]TFI60305.1 hypothetical protein E2493_00930 [Sphingomonas parva]
MKFVSSLAIAASLIVGGAGATAAFAQQNAKGQAAPAPQRQVKLSNEAKKAIGELQAAVTANAPDYAQRLAAAQAVAKSTDDRYYIARLQLDHASNIKDNAAVVAAAEAIIASGGADAAETDRLRRGIASAAAGTGDWARAEAQYAALSAAAPNDVDLLLALARTKIGLNKQGEALPLYQRAIQASKAAGQKPEEGVLQNVIKMALEQKNSALALEAAREAVTLYPNKRNFQNLVAVSNVGGDDATVLDFARLRYMSGLLGSGRDYLALAERLDYDNFPGEAKAVLEAASRAGQSTGPQGAALLTKVNGRIAEDRAALSTVEPKARSAANGSMALSLATAHAGYGNFAKAIELYQLALQKGGVDADTVRTRLGIAYAQAGQRAEAEAAFRAVTGPRAGLAGLWLAWLSQQG